MISKIVCGVDRDSCYGYYPKKEIRLTIVVKKSLRAAEDDLSNDLRIGMNRFLSEISKAKCNGVWWEKFLNRKWMIASWKLKKIHCLPEGHVVGMSWCKVRSCMNVLTYNSFMKQQFASFLTPWWSRGIFHLSVPRNFKNRLKRKVHERKQQQPTTRYISSERSDNDNANTKIKPGAVCSKKATARSNKTMTDNNETRPSLDWS